MYFFKIHLYIQKYEVVSKPLSNKTFDNEYICPSQISKQQIIFVFLISPSL